MARKYNRYKWVRWYTIKHPDGLLSADNMAITAAACRKKWSRKTGASWQKLKAEGYSVVRVRIVEEKS